MKMYYYPSSGISNDITDGDTKSKMIRPSLNIKSSTNLQLPNRNQVKKKVGRYYYLETEQIGKGFTSSVYKAYSAEDIKSSIPTQTYAIKVMPLNLANSTSIQLLQNQIEILKLVDHPNVIKCYDIYKSKTHCYIITEFCEEGCLSDFITQNKSVFDNKKYLTEDKIIDITQQIVEGLKYLFQKGIIHRDIKPANILKGRNGWKIADFGFAILSSNEIKSKFNVGTPLYMPLQSLKQNLYSPQSDIFSVGIIIYELFTGRTPWQSKSQKQLIRKMQFIPLGNTPGNKKISFSLLRLIQKLCSLQTKTRMSQQQFMTLNLRKFIEQQNQQSKSLAQSDNWSKQLKSIRSQIQLQRKLNSMKSTDQFPFIQARSTFLDPKNTFSTKNLILQQERQKIKTLYRPSLLIPNIQQQQNDGKTLKSYGSKQQIYTSLKYKYLDTPSSIRASQYLKNDPAVNMKKYFPRASEQITVKSSTRLDFKKQVKNQDHTRCTEDKESQSQNNPEFEDRKLTKEELKYIEEVSYILLNQIHFCRFLFYLYKNSLYILVGKKSQDKLAVLIFKMIFSTFQDLNSLQVSTQRLKSKSIPLYFKDKFFRVYLKSEKHEMMRKTIKQYKEKYEKQYALLKIRLGQNFIEEIEMGWTQFMSKKVFTQSSTGQLKFVLEEIKIFLKEFDHNLNLTMDTISNTQRTVTSPRYANRNAFIAANVEGIKNLYQFYKLTKIMIQNDKDMLKFERKSKIKVVTDYAKNTDFYFEQLRNIRDLIRSL